MNTKMSVDKAIGKWVRFRLIEDFPRYLVGATTGIYEPQGWIKAKLSGVDEFGIWLENPNLPITDFVDSEGNQIPPDQRKEVIKTATVLIRWNFVASIIYIETDSPNQDESSVPMGFRPPAPRATKGAPDSSEN